MTYRIAVDAMGGDNAPAAIVEGCVAAAVAEDVEVILVGNKEKIADELIKYDYHEAGAKISLVGADEVIENEDNPIKAIRTKRNSSMLKAIDLVKEGKADAALSAGNTGALMAGSLMILKKIPGADRPAIASVYPYMGEKEGMSILVDAGANSECKPAHLLSFAKMGSIYMKYAYGVEHPRVGLINIGVEETKGTPVLKETHQLLKNSSLNFVGNIEGRNLPFGDADVLVCDGFTGNVVLKLTEGVAMALLGSIKSKLESSPVSMLGGALVKGKFKDLKKRFDYSSYGAAPILGVNGLVFKMHGASNGVAAANAVSRAALICASGLLEEMKEKLEADNGSGTDSGLQLQE